MISHYMLVITEYCLKLKSLSIPGNINDHVEKNELYKKHSVNKCAIENFGSQSVLDRARKS